MGRRVKKKRLFCAFGMGLSAENVGKSQGKCENNALEKMIVFGPFWGPWLTISRQETSLCCDKVLNVSCVF